MDSVSVSDSLPNDLLTDIMSRIPGKNLARFRLVSKQFMSLLSDPCFIRLHHNRSLDSLLTLTALRQSSVQYDFFHAKKYYNRQLIYNFLVTGNDNDLVHEFTEEFSGDRIRILSSYHQLVCFGWLDKVHLYDPMNNKLITLPNPPLYPPCRCEIVDCIFSFGFVDATMQYKVIKWSQDLDKDRTRTLSSGLITTWKKVETKFMVLNIDIVENCRLKVSHWRRVQKPCPYLLQLSSQVHVNGFVYWTTSDFQLVSFSLQDKTFSALTTKPQCFGSQRLGHFFTLSGSRGSLWMIDYDVSCRMIDIWKMEESQRGEWVRVHRIYIGGVEYLNNNDDKVPEMLDICSDKVVFKLSSLISYDANTKTFESSGLRSVDYQLCHSTDGLLSLHNIGIRTFI